MDKQNPNQKLESLLKANLILSSTLNTRELLTQIIKLATDVAGAQRASILLYDKKDDTLIFDVALGDSSRNLSGIRLKSGEGIAGACARDRVAIVINEVEKDSRWSKTADEKTNFKTKSLVAVPMIFKDELVGVLEAINKDGGDFINEDILFLESFAAQAASAIVNARAFGELFEEKEKLNAIFAQMTDCAVLLNKSAEVILLNPAAQANFGCGCDKVLFSALIDNYNLNPALPDLQSSKTTTTPFELSRKNGKAHFLSGFASRMKNSKNEVTGLLLVFRDITAEKNESLIKRNFISLISHKLRTPLVSIIGYSALFAGKNEIGEMGAKAMASIHKQSTHLARLVEKLINFSIMENRATELSFAKHSFAELTAGALQNLKAYLTETSAQVSVDEKINELGIIQMDIEKLEIALRNILENAVKFNTRANKEVKIQKASQGEYEGISIEDNGPGIPPEEHSRIFTRFYQVEESFTGQVEGAGLGLPLAKHIIEAHTGKIKIESKINQGTKVFMLFKK